MKNISKSIICIETGIIYKNSVDAGEKLNIIPNNIRECCRGIRKTAGGFHWKDTNSAPMFIPDGFIPIDFLPNYYINRNGDIYSTHYQRMLKQQISDRGYSIIRISVDGKKRTLRIHQLVAKIFIPNPKGYKEINHKDENKQNNSVDNLEWCTRSYNMSYGTVKQRILDTKNKNRQKIQKSLANNEVVLWETK